MRVKPLIAVPLIAIALAGCSTQQPTEETSTAAAQEQPLFSSDEEALAAAQVAYANYLEVSDQIARDGGANPQRLKGLVSDELLDSSSDFANQILSQQLIAVGQSQTDSFHVQSRSISSEGETISIYVCLRLSGVRILDVSGQDVTPASRQDSLPMLLTFKADRSEPKLVLDSSEVWTGTNFC